MNTLTIIWKRLNVLNIRVLVCVWGGEGWNREVSLYTVGPLFHEVGNKMFQWYRGCPHLGRGRGYNGGFHYAYS